MVTSLHAVVVPAAIVVLVAKLLSWRRKTKCLPPGPPKLPFIDNLHNMPAGIDWVKFHELAKQYDSDIIHFSALGYSIVVLDSFEAAKELLENRSGIYSSRPASVMMNELADMGSLISLVPYGDRFRANRRTFAKHVGNARLNRPRELFYARRCLGQLLETPDDFHRHLQYLMGSISLSMTFGLKAQAHSDKYIDLAQKLVEIQVDIAAAGLFIVDLFPPLKYVPAWFPGAKFQQIGSECSRSLNQTRESLFKVATDTMETMHYTPSFVSEVLGEINRGNASIDIKSLKSLAMATYLGAADTTWSALTVFILAMVSYPEVQKKAQNELDAVLAGKLPKHDDIMHLPYLTAVFMEVIRWRPVTPFGLPHLNTMDDTYRGYLIPNGSMIIANQWAMLHDPIAFPEPSEFRPERFLNYGKIDESIRSPFNIAFGFGRRICPGRYIAQSTFMIVAASILSTFDLLMKKDANGVPVRPDPDYHLSLICRPKDFPCVILPRSLATQQLIEDWIAAEGDSPP